jgi:hypothetical protein
MTAEQSKYIDLTQTGSVETVFETEAILEQEKPEAVIEDVQHVAPPATEMPVVSEESPADVEAEAVSVEVPAAEPSLPSESAPVGGMPVQEPETADSVVAFESSSVITPQSVPPSIEEHTEIVGHAETGELHPGVPDTHSSSQSKTRWKTWKEKIQEFIKKLFG